ncbi:MFS general substrate transporter [Rhizodiscina lignyota]|uniref:MFS general substrate transporter n=1 Tax=Rhizodiscina lignyota TaxID=1504668 RepID=A0A9P4I6U5_9PEZI|nr:MFS general substrate transporter [Rhizodiscina lignyota]
MAPRPTPSSYFTKDERVGDLSPPKDVEIAKESEPEWKPNRAEYLVVSCLALASLIVSLDATIFVTILPEITRDLHGTSTEAFWIGTTYLLTSAVFQCFIVSLSDIFGRRPLLIVSLALFTIGTIVCCTAPNFTQLLAGRCVQGVGGGGVIAFAQVILTDIIPLRQRPSFIAIVQAAWAVGTVSGPLLGGAIAQSTTWRWVFYLNFPICAISLIMAPLVVKLEAPRAFSFKLFLEVDWVGAFLFIASTTSFLIGVLWGGSQFPWDSWHTLVPLILGAAGVGASIIWEVYGTSTPFLRLSIFSNVSSVAAYFGAFTQGMLLFCILYYIPLYLRVTQDFSPLLTGVGCMPVTVILLPSSAIVGALMRKYGVFRPAIWVGWTITILSQGLLILLDADTKTWVWVVIFCVVGGGHGLILMAVGYSIQAVTDPKIVAYATAMYTFLRSFGFCVGVAIGSAVFQNRLEQELKNLHLPPGAATDSEGFVTILHSMPTSSPARHAYNVAYAKGIQTVFLVLTILAALGGLSSLFIKHRSTDKALASEHRLSQRSEKR